MDDMSFAGGSTLQSLYEHLRMINFNQKRDARDVDSIIQNLPTKLRDLDDITVSYSTKGGMYINACFSVGTHLVAVLPYETTLNGESKIPKSISDKVNAADLNPEKYTRQITEEGESTKDLRARVAQEIEHGKQAYRSRKLR